MESETDGSQAVFISRWEIEDRGLEETIQINTRHTIGEWARGYGQREGEDPRPVIEIVVDEWLLCPDGGFLQLLDVCVRCAFMVVLDGEERLFEQLLVSHIERELGYTGLPLNLVSERLRKLLQHPATRRRQEDAPV